MMMGEMVMPSAADQTLSGISVSDFATPVIATPITMTAMDMACWSESLLR